MPTYARQKAPSLTAPSNLAASAVSDSQINLTWKYNSSNELGFVVQQSASEIGPWSSIATTSKAVANYSNTGLRPSTRNYYRVYAYNSYGSSSYAGPVNATTWAPSCTATVSMAVSPAGGGTTGGGGTVNCGSSVTVVATAAPGYNFAGWTENGAVVSTTASYTFTAGANRTLVANFSAVPCTFSLSATGTSLAAAGGSGSVSVTASASTCPWSSSTTYEWLHTSSSGTGGGVANFTVDPSPNPSSRSGTLTIAGQTFSVTQGAHSAPTANPGPNQSTSVGTSVTFNGSGSSAMDGAVITNYAWGLGDLSYAYGISFTHAYSAAGSYTVTLTVTDSIGVTGSGACSVLVTNVPCALNPALTTPVSGAMVSNTVTLTATASSCATGIDFYCDNTVLVGSATVSPFSVSWNTTTLANGSHNLSAKAYDAAGNSSTSASITVTVSNITSAPGQLAWAQTGAVPAANTATATRVAVDGSGNVVAVGYFNGSVDFGPGAMPSDGGLDCFVVKYNVPGAVVWAKRFGGLYDDILRGVAVDASGNIFVTGSFIGTVDFGGTALTSVTNASPLAGPYSSDIFVAKYSPSGSLLWVKNFGGTGGDEGRAVAVDGSGNIVLAAALGSANVAFGSTVLNSSGGDVVVVANLANADGSVLWAGQWGNPASYPIAAAADGSGNVLVTGTVGGGADLFVAKFSAANGANLWSKTVGSAGYNYGNGVAVDPTTGNVIVTGSLGAAANFGGGATSSGGVFLAAYDSSGNYLWAKTFNTSLIPPASSDSGNAVSVDSSGNIGLTGTAALLNLGAGWTRYEGYFLATFTGAGGYRWAIGVPSSNGSASGCGIAFDTLGHVVTAGNFTGTANLDGVSVTAQTLSTAPFCAQYAN